MKRRSMGWMLTLCATMGCGSSSEAGAPPQPTSDADPADVVAQADAGADVADGAIEGGDAPTGILNVPGKYVHKPTVEGIARELIVYVPEKARGNTRAPVVFMLHGTSGDGEKFFNISGWREKADAEGLIAVFPSALTYCFYDDEDFDGRFIPKERVVTTKWAGGKLGDPVRRPLCSAAEISALPPEKRALVDHPLKDDVAFFGHMLDFLGTSYSIDPKRIYASGFSNGAEMTSRLAIDLADRFAAIAASASTMSVTPRPSRPMTFVWTVGERDPGLAASMGLTTFPLDDSLGSIPAFTNSVVKPYTTTVSIAETWTHANRTIGGVKLSQLLFTESTAGATNTFRALIVEGVEHQYPNGKNSPVRMAELLWEIWKDEKLP